MEDNKNKLRLIYACDFLSLEAKGLIATLLSLEKSCHVSDGLTNVLAQLGINEESPVLNELIDKGFIVDNRFDENTNVHDTIVRLAFTINVEYKIPFDDKMLEGKITVPISSLRNDFNVKEAVSRGDLFVITDSYRTIHERSIKPLPPKMHKS